MTFFEVFKFNVENINEHLETLHIVDGGLKKSNHPIVNIL
jgi:hypothetical protein